MEDKDVPWKLVMISIGVAFVGMVVGFAIEPPHETCSCSSASTMAGVLGLIGLFGTPFILGRTKWFRKKL